MAKHANTNSGHAENGEGGLLRGVILLALPLLRFHGEMLAVAKKGIKDASHVKPVENLALRELQALMMILDRSRTLRDRIGIDFEKKAAEVYNEVVPKVISGSIDFIDAQEKILEQVMGVLTELKNNKKPKGRTSRKAAD
jgi:hypothetical protein